MITVEDKNRLNTYCSKCQEAKYEKIEVPKENGKIFEIVVSRACRCEREAYEREEELKKKKELEEYRKYAIEIEKYREYTFDKDNRLDKEISESCRKYVENFEKLRTRSIGLLFYGGIGTGKTYYAHAIANALIDKGYRVKSTSLVDVLQLEFEGKQKEIEYILASEIIVLDDIGAERQTLYAEEKRYKFINRATALNKILILTTNLTLKEIKEMREDTSNLERARVYSRVLEKCMPLKVNSIKQRENNELENRKFMQEILKGR